MGVGACKEEAIAILEALTVATGGCVVHGEYKLAIVPTVAINGVVDACIAYADVAAN